MSEPFWQTKFRGVPMRLTLNDLSNQRLREVKSRFGPDYGIPTEFMRLLLVGDMDAITAAVWIGQQKAGGEVEDLSTLDFNIEDDFEKLEDPKPAGKKGAKGKENPTPPSTTTDDSPETPSPTETDSSSTSGTSSD